MKEIYSIEVIRHRYNRYSKFYDVFEAPMEMFLGKWRRELIKYSSGKVLEVGVGTGKNIEYYPNDIDLTAIDFSEGMLSKAIKKYKRKPNVKFIQMDIQATDFETDTFDTVIASYVFCSVPDPVTGLKEIKRICKNDGKIILLEHVRSDNKLIGLSMDLLNPLIVGLFGFNINRDTENNIVNSGFDSYQVRYLWYDFLRMFIINNKK
ncbi:MAG: methyltransferase type 11 [Ignavibacteria bacterium RIFOXYB2_FULL_35_12]|nr:MAG: methyltransferase type 11 [Ignavibacteria bacterium GWF2_35_20]OGU81903.1 MAG: methyltransferase type 11 [Ignavibacteria bacterium RIFOXYA2_FULL_35_9]OGU90814.1 MAG: methyltransferase type 11 [Ignavibacteria bacterium RIFOXYA12_FULL_35_25]OGU91490.1 MAG: methyltransferase type 11 [Ignavibacteria bacterium RIFOXYC12_FULL_35_11]OGU94472.1 MAG: methyltransferase type 11 [Ignavibacteria bacterium RIFOXYB12_FULL_35_14]OGU99710.1 MAG: methyltransferase type 11 [Ignavibacteria bacterium RIFOX